MARCFEVKKAGGSQVLDQPLNPKLLMSKGKLDELKELYLKKPIDAVVFIMN